MGVLSIFLIPIIILILLIIIFLLNFYRDPERTIPQGSNIVSPADGKIISIIKTKNSKITVNKGIIGKIQTLTKGIAKPCCIISIFMSPFDVHVNRAPLEGKIESIKHEKGKYFAAFNFENSLMNEKNEIIIKSRKIGKIKLIQVAGFLARRIICSLNKNEKVNKGQRLGRIVLGSQVVLVLPSKKIELRVKNKQKVIGGNTIIARIK